MRKKQKLLGQYIVANPEICHGKPTFIGTRIMAFQVLRQLGLGVDWNVITEAWGGKVCKIPTVPQAILFSILGGR